MITQLKIDSVFDSNPEFRNHFILKCLSLKSDDFLYVSLKEDSNGKDLESIILILYHFIDKIVELKINNVAFSFKEIEYFADLGNAAIVNLAIRIDNKGGKFIVIEPKPKIKDVLEILGLDECWPIYNSEKEFIDDMNK
ncbi:STAS domain-containing protein [Rufibacter hautae]|uniref:STAS domain-containing protein n=1 Tax=Rufibacter hautae TaxID=2595005 RepID=A0A5B6TGG9_9BACT|nr:STAS domain-containing protein [Rufibacter hautae]KAA3439752.1 hypothetical protein FOA19_03485 [Rufibacter hautae]